MVSIARTRRESFGAIARGESQRALDVARGLGAGEVRTTVRADANRLTLIAIALCVVTSPILFIAPQRALRDADYSAIRL